ncbi:MAG TPA: hypothetical protein VH857_01520, partial [Actinomycetes bacterium]|nr:hypothetical protein [Actinomycetes bacterium]
LFTGVFFFAQLLQVVLGYDALGAGLRLLPWTACFITIAPLAGTLADRIGERWLLSVGLALEAVGMFWLVSVSSVDMTYGQMVGRSSSLASVSRWRSRARRTRSSAPSTATRSARLRASTR